MASNSSHQTTASFKLLISLRQAQDGEGVGIPVFHKQDGERFEDMTTVKLNADTKYNIKLTTRPANGINRVLLRGEELELSKQKPELGDENCCIYQCEWSTQGLEVTKGGTRTYIQFMVETEDKSSVTVGLQVKVYPAAESTHSRWGQELGMLEVDCDRQAGAGDITVVRQAYN